VRSTVGATVGEILYVTAYLHWHTGGAGRTVPSVVPFRGLSGVVHELPDNIATLLAENLRNYSVYDPDDASSAADKIELRLSGADETPIGLALGERLEVAKFLDVLSASHSDPNIAALFFDLHEDLPSYKPRDETA